MPDYPIKLGKKMDETAMPVPSKEDKDQMYYPSIYLTWDDKYELPASGEMTVKFRVASETNRTDRDGDTSQSVDVEILSIESVTPDKKEDEDRGDEIDRLAKKGRHKEDDSEDY